MSDTSVNIILKYILKSNEAKTELDPETSPQRTGGKLRKGELISTTCIVIGLACRKDDEVDCGQQLSQ